MFEESPRWSVLFIFLVCLESLLIVVVSIWIVADPSAFKVSSSDSSLIFLILIEQAFFTVFMAFQSVLEESKYAMLVLFAVEVESIYRSFYLAFHSSSTISGVAIGMLSVFLALTVLSIGFGVRVLQGMGWRFFKIVGSNLELKQMFETHQKILCLLKLDVQAVFRLIIASFFYFKVQDLWYPLLIIALEIFWDISIRFSLYQERPVLMNVALVTLFVAFCLNFVQVFITPVGSRDPQIRAALVLPALVTIIVSRFLLLFYGRIARNNFGKGLIENVFSKLDDDFLLRNVFLRNVINRQPDLRMETSLRHSSQLPLESA